MKFEATYPDSRKEILLFVPRYDFAWQHRYVLASPKRLPKGTVIQATAVYDNSETNPNNPDPSAVVRYGKQTTDEMFQGYFEVFATKAPAPIARIRFWFQERTVTYALPLISCLGLAIGCYSLRRAWSRFVSVIHMRD